MSLTFSVVITTRHRAAVLAESLDAIDTARTDMVRDVIVVDNSDPDRGDTMATCASRPWVRYIRVRPCTNYLTLPRNVGVANASGDIIAFLDDDAIIVADWFDICAAGFAEASVGIVGGRILDPEVEGLDHDRDAPIGRILPNGALTDNFDCAPDEPVEIDHMRGCNWAFRRQLFIDIGWYDEGMHGYCFEELDTCLRARQLGYRVLFEPRLRVYHKLAAREVAGRFELTAAKRRHLHGNLSYVYAKNVGPLSMFYLRFLLTCQSHLRATIRRPTARNAAVVCAGFQGKLTGLARYFRRRGDLRRAGAVPRLRDTAVHPLRRD